MEGAGEARWSKDVGLERRSVLANINLRWNSVLRRRPSRSSVDSDDFLLWGKGANVVGKIEMLITVKCPHKAGIHIHHPFIPRGPVWIKPARETISNVRGYRAYWFRVPSCRRPAVSRRFSSTSSAAF